MPNLLCLGLILAPPCAPEVYLRHDQGVCRAAGQRLHQVTFTGQRYSREGCAWGQSCTVEIPRGAKGVFEANHPVDALLLA